MSNIDILKQTLKNISLNRPALGIGAGPALSLDSKIQPFINKLLQIKDKFKNTEINIDNKQANILKNIPKISDQEQNLLKDVIWSESRLFGSIPTEELKQEMRDIINVAKNRMKETGETLKQVLTKPHQFKGINIPQSKRRTATNQNEPEKRKNKILEETFTEFISGQLQDTTGGANSFRHTTKDSKRMFETFSQELAK
mgnify:CR=1 FL=1